MVPNYAKWFYMNYPHTLCSHPMQVGTYEETKVELYQVTVERVGGRIGTS